MPAKKRKDTIASSEKKEKQVEKPAQHVKVKNKVPIYLIVRGFKFLPPVEGNMEYSIEILYKNEQLKALTTTCSNILINPYGNFCSFKAGEPLEVWYSITIIEDNLDDINVLSLYPLIVKLHIRQVAYCPPGKIPCLNLPASFECVNAPPPPKCCIKEIKILPKKPSSPQFILGDFYGEGEEEFEGGLVEADTEGEVELDDVIEDLPFEENYHCLAQGHYDLLKIIDHTTINDTVSIVLYSVLDEKIDPIEFIMQIQTKIPILRNRELPLINAAFITLESIFDIPVSWMSEQSEAHVKFEVLPIPDQTTKPIELCSFTTKIRELYERNNFIQKWAKLIDKSDYPINAGLTTGRILKDSFDDIFSGHTIDYSKFDKNSNVLIFNALNRLMFTEKERLMFESFIGRAENHIHVTLVVSFAASNGHPVHYSGNCDLSALLYPNVNQGRFAIPLAHDAIPDPTKPKIKEKPKKTSVDPVKLTQIVAEQIEPILVFEIAFWAPLTERLSSKGKFSCVKLPILPVTPMYTPEKYFPIKELQLFTDRQFKAGIWKIISMMPVRLNDFNESNWLDLDCVAVLDNMPEFEQIKEISKETILGLISAKYNIDKHTETNIEFRELMVDVYNDIIQHIDDTVDENYAGGYDVVKSKDDRKMQIYTALECQQLDFEDYHAQIWKTLEQKSRTTEDLFEINIKNVINYDLENISIINKKILAINPKHYYSVLQRTYIKYKLHGEDRYINEITLLTIEFPNAIEPWVLLYCLYSDCKYRPGYHFAKMNIKKVFRIPEKLPSFMDAKDVFLEPIEFKQNPFIFSMCVFLKMGLHEYVELVFNYCKNDLTAKDRHTIEWSLHIYLGRSARLEDILGAPNFDLYPGLDSLRRAFSGHAKYCQNDKLSAINEYELIYNSKNYIDEEDYQHIAFLRCGFWYLNQKHFENARSYFITCCKNSQSFLSFYGAGICYFNLDSLEDAEIAFSNATKYRIEFSIIWMYLAIINLKFNKTKKAAECYLAAKRAGPLNMKLEQDYSELLEKNLHSGNLLKITLKN